MSGITRSAESSEGMPPPNIPVGGPPPKIQVGGPNPESKQPKKETPAPPPVGGPSEKNESEQCWSNSPTARINQLKCKIGMLQHIIKDRDQIIKDRDEIIRAKDQELKIKSKAIRGINEEFEQEQQQVNVSEEGVIIDDMIIGVTVKKRRRLQIDLEIDLG